MRIAVIEHLKSGDYAEYIYSLIYEQAKENDYQFKTWSSSVPAALQQVDDNTIIYININNNSSLLLSWMYNVKIPSILKKTKAEIVVDLNGIASSKMKIPQVICGGSFLFDKDEKQLSGTEKYALKNFNDSLKAAGKAVIYSKQNFNEAIKIDATKSDIIPFTAPEIFRVYEWHDKLMIKSQYADNKEYFLAVIDDNGVNDFVLLLQAFSKFKKWQESSMQLLIFPKREFFDSAILEKYKTYKYRDDVRLLEDIDERQTAAIFASAYSFLHANTASPNLLMIAAALQCGLPIISFANNEVTEYAKDAALYCNNNDALAFGETIIRLYKDENLHAQLKQNAQQQSALLNRQENEDKLWQLLHSVASYK